MRVRAIWDFECWIMDFDLVERKAGHTMRQTLTAICCLIDLMGG